MKNEFKLRLQKSLAESGMNAAELSEKTGISEANISNYINGKYVAKQDKCFLLAKALGVDPGWLMTGYEPATAETTTETEKQVTPEINIVSGAMSMMSKEEQEQVINVLRAVFVNNPKILDQLKEGR